ncbi:MAG TPA: GMC family oxidoreductase [Solirubrobacteraceae bacterium]|nr:GMC family oxidoreductase [Solirubrobacteraceae bacterium]
MSDRYEVVVVGSGAGGGVTAGELADAGRRVLLLESGPHRTAADFTRWEAHASHDIWWPIAMAEPAGSGTPPLPLFRGHCVGGTTTINTKVALRPTAQDFEKWHAAGGLAGENGAPFGAADLDAHFERVEARLGVRERSDWQQCVRTVVPGFEALGAGLEPVMSYTDHNCMRCGSCLQGCPTNAGKSTMSTYIHPPWAEGRLELRAGCRVTRVVIEDGGDGPVAGGVEYVDGAGVRHLVEADVVVVAAGALATSQLLLRSGVREAGGGSASGALIGRCVGFHPARLVEGLFDEVQDAHMVYPITAHCMTFQRDEDGGFIVEAATVQDPIGFATALSDERGVPLWGAELTEMMRRYRYFTGLLTMVSDENHGMAWIDERGRDRYSYQWSEAEQGRNQRSLEFAREVLLASGARRVLQTGLLSTHIQGGCRMGSDPERSVLDARGESHDVRRLFVGDGSVLPCTLSVNPSLTIMSLASRLAAYLAGGEHGYFSRVGAPSTPAPV